MDIAIDEKGVRISPLTKQADAAPSASSAAAPDSVASASAPASSAAPAAPPTTSAPSIEIKLPPGLSPEVREAVREAVSEARTAIQEAIEEHRDATREAQQAPSDAAIDLPTRMVERTRRVHWGDFLTDLALLWVVGSSIIKATYKGRMQAEAKAAVATETAESESLKRQVMEARMAAMQAQVEPHFLFNTLASIDHLIETDAARASHARKTCPMPPWPSSLTSL
jgi:uncharacterized membrane protein